MYAGKRRTLRSIIVRIFSHMTRGVSVFVICDTVFRLYFGWKLLQFRTSKFCKLVWQLTEGMVGSIIWVLLQIDLAFYQWNNFENPLRIDKVIAMSLVYYFFWGQSVYNLAVVIHMTTCSAVCSIGCHKLSYSQLDIIIKWMVLAETATCWLITTAICEDELSIVSCSSTVSATTVGDCCSWVIYRPSTLSTHQLLYYADMLFWLWMSVSDSHVAIAAVVVMWIFITIFDGEQFV